jgi:hypothetical protein
MVRARKSCAAAAAHESRRWRDGDCNRGAAGGLCRGSAGSRLCTKAQTVVEHKLLGLIPLDADDEGLDPIGVEVTVKDIFQFFEELMHQCEVIEACTLLAGGEAKRG